MLMGSSSGALGSAMVIAPLPRAVHRNAMWSKPSRSERITGAAVRLKFLLRRHPNVATEARAAAPYALGHLSSTRIDARIPSPTRHGGSSEYETDGTGWNR